MTPTNRTDEASAVLTDLFNKFIKKWTGDSYPHLIDSDENDGERFRQAIASQVQRAVEAEREACAKFAESWLSNADSSYYKYKHYTGEQIAAAITNERAEAEAIKNAVLNAHPDGWLFKRGLLQNGDGSNKESFDYVEAVEWLGKEFNASVWHKCEPEKIVFFDDDGEEREIEYVIGDGPEYDSPDWYQATEPHPKIAQLEADKKELEERLETEKFYSGTYEASLQDRIIELEAENTALKSKLKFEGIDAESYYTTLNERLVAENTALKEKLADANASTSREIRINLKAKEENTALKAERDEHLLHRRVNLQTADERLERLVNSEAEVAKLRKVARAFSLYFSHLPEDKTLFTEGKDVLQDELVRLHGQVSDALTNLEEGK